ncbi:MAG: class I SAM-dependent methyltransferase [Chthoniobacteraceae bacterium]
MKYTPLTDELQDYLVARRSPDPDALLEQLRQETETLGEVSGMLIGREQGTLLTLLVAALGAKHVVEVGTFTGYSATCIARGLPAGGHLWCFDVSEEWTSIGRRYWQQAGLAHRITLTLGPAVETLPALANGLEIDLAFIDADKPSYDHYYELVLPRLRQNGLIIFDNMLYHGSVLNPVEENPIAIDRLNRKLASDPRIQSVLLPVGDGIHVCRKL